MPTYKVEFSLAFGAQPVERLRAISCEQCEKSVGEVSTARIRYGMSADEVIKTWPILRGAVERHEEDCRAKRPSRH
jgi:hypothetical protein